MFGVFRMAWSVLILLQGKILVRYVGWANLHLVLCVCFCLTRPVCSYSKNTPSLPPFELHNLLTYLSVTLCATLYQNSDLYFPSSHSHFQKSSLWIIKNIQMQNIGGKSQEYLEFSITFLAQNRLHFLGCLFFMTISPAGETHEVYMMWCRWHMQRDAHIPGITSHHVMRIADVISCVTGVLLCAGRRPGKISTLEISVPQKNKRPRKYNYSGPEKLKIFWSLLWHRICWE